MDFIDAKFVAAVALLALLTISPGPSMALIATITFREGRRAAYFTALGLASCLPVHGAASALGLALLLATVPAAYLAVKVIGATYLVFLGLSALRRSPAGGAEVGSASVARTWHSAYLRGFVSNLLNPKVAVFYLTFVPQFMVPQQTVLERSLLLALIHSIVDLVWLVVYASLLDRIGRVLYRGGLRLWLVRVTGAALVAVGVRVAFDSPSPAQP